MDIFNFAELVKRVPFLIFPTVRLQQAFKDKFGGKSLWDKFEKRLEQRKKEEKEQEQREAFVKRKELQKEKELDNKLKQYKERKEEWWQDYTKN